jgi:hypothetical protein
MKEKIERAAAREANGTHLLGEISGVSFDRIRKSLGEPEGGDEVDRITDWHVGAHDLSASEAREIMAALWMLLGGNYNIDRRI